MQFQTSTAPPPPADWEGASEVSLQLPLRHIPAGDARIFEGWASLSTVDNQNDLIPAHLLEAAAEAYMRSNPVIIWHHIPILPIGRVLRMRVEEKGVYIRAEILQGTQIRSSVTGDNVDYASIATVADETWNLIKMGLVRGLSIRLRKRGPFKEHDTPYGKVREVQAVAAIIEISVTPLPVNVGCQIDGANMLAKALPLGKATPLGENTMSKILQAQEALNKALLEAAQAGQDIPPAFLENHDILNKALGITPNAPADPNASKIAELEAQIASLKGQPAPPRARQTLDANPGAPVRPADTTNTRGLMSKAIEIAGDPLMQEKLGLDLADIPHQYDLMTMITANSRGKILVREQLNISPHAQAYLQRIGQLHQEGKIRV